MKEKILLVFDIDDTLTRSALLHQEAFIATLNALGIEEMDTRFGEYLHHTDSYVAGKIYETAFGRPFSDETRAKFERILSEKVSRLTFPEIEGAAETIREVQKNERFGLCFATGSLRRPAEQKLKGIGISFDAKQLVASDFLHERESIVGAAIEQAKENYQVNEFSRIISFGDGLWDLKTAANLDLEFVGIGDRNKDILIRNGCKHHYSNFSTLKLHEI